MGQPAPGRGKIACLQRVGLSGCHARLEIGKPCLRLLVGNDARAAEDDDG